MIFLRNPQRAACRFRLQPLCPLLSARASARVYPKLCSLRATVRESTSARSGADALILDLEDSVAVNVKPDVRRNVASMLGQRESEQTIIVRVNAFDTGMTSRSACDRREGGRRHAAEMLLRWDVDRMSHYLEAFEVAAGIKPGRTAEADETALLRRW
jgi:citrate lyase beta subunit